MTTFRTLNEITSALNGARMHPAGKLNGMFFRREDFETSTKQLMKQLSVERALASKFVNKGYGDESFSASADAYGVRLHGRSFPNNGIGTSSFDTYDLSPALRHFLNDYCRVLEPLVKLLAKKHPGVPAVNSRRPHETVSLNAYLKLLKKAGIQTPLDHDYFLNLYEELWNDYKHAESAGVQASGWSSDGMRIASEPKLSSLKLIYFKNMTVENFIDKSLDNMKVLLDYVA